MVLVWASPPAYGVCTSATVENQVLRVGPTLPGLSADGLVQVGGSPPMVVPAKAFRIGQRGADVDAGALSGAKLPRPT